MSDVTIIPGCEPMSHAGTRNAGVLVLHGFTGNPSSMRIQANAFAELGYHVELPRLPGHGTSVDDMLTTDFIVDNTQKEFAKLLKNMSKRSAMKMNKDEITVQDKARDRKRTREG